MEAVGLAVAVGSIAKAGCVAVKFASKIRKVAKEAGTVGQRMEQRSLIFQTFGKSIKMAQESMLDHCPKGMDSEDSPAIKYMKENDFLEILQSQSFMIMDDILAWQEQIWSVIPKRGPRRWREFKTSWNWVDMDQQIMSLHPQMESLKSTMTLTLNIIILEVTVAKNKIEPSAEQEKEIQLLKTNIEELIDDVRHVRECLAHIQDPVYASNRSVRSLSRSVDPLKVICHLGHSLVERDAVPKKPPESFSFKEAKRSRQYRRRHSRQIPSDDPYKFPAPVSHEQAVPPNSSDSISSGPLPSSPYPQMTKDSNPQAHSISPSEYRLVGAPYISRLRLVRTAEEHRDISDLESRTRRTGNPRQSIVPATEVPKPTEYHSTDIPDSKTRIPHVAEVIEPDIPPKNETPTLTPPIHTENAQDAPGEINNARARRARRKQRQASTASPNPDISARYRNLKPIPRPRSPPKNVEDTGSEIGYDPVRSLSGSATVHKPDRPSGSETLKPRSRGPPQDVIDPCGVVDIDHDTASNPSVLKQKQNTQPPPLDVAVQTEPTPPPTPISPIQPSSIITSSSSSAYSSSSQARRTPIIPQPRHPAPNPPGQPIRETNTNTNNTKKEIQAAYIINPKTLKKTSFEVRIDRKYPRNLITLSHAKKLGIDKCIVYQTHKEEYQYRGTNIALIGKAQLKWSTVPEDTLVEPGDAEVLVCEDSAELQHPLIFGGWFVGARKNLSLEEAREEEEESLDFERGAVDAGMSLSPPTV
ncbi:hypothetical protein V8F20_010295 [Naviculisporaceae sp. PSN 640]